MSPDEIYNLNKKLIIPLIVVLDFILAHKILLFNILSLNLFLTYAIITTLIACWLHYKTDKTFLVSDVAKSCWAP